MKCPLSLWLAVALMMFPQIVETIYSPALTNIATAFNITAEQASQTLSLYFFAFALGVVFWGRMCDILGRRPTILAGLLLYGIASICSLFISHFYLLLLMRMLSAFGAAVGSIGTQTIMRDSYKGYELAKIFSIMGSALAISPAFGMLAGAVLVDLGGYLAVFIGLAVLAIGLLVWSCYRLSETRPKNVTYPPFFNSLFIMIRDKEIFRNVMLIAFFNISLFSYYQLAPFMFEQLMLSQQQFGLTGILLAVGVGIGSILNRYLLTKNWSPETLVRLSSVVSLISGCLVFILMHSVCFIFPMMGIVIGYGIAIPNILAHALHRYADIKGTAGAILGLFYYTGLAIGLMIAGWSQHLGGVLIISGIVLTVSSLRYRLQIT
ncbi:multidrug effflux MFS transporter [Providencia burhodogranariea]|uniref:Bcr/CflA family efflux transporter n=1 Tax=Providencia burhodogranariea DSM 19968 TaxID=1141662 RepID=K8WM56_9GAMM|nr:multidrug effflux MFS transporter [Providencia burhodogranariea]EKT61698.1 hypothetical protein OOA_10363 [Providencia burhodogranariea DSM 19968]